MYDEVQHGGFPLRWSLHEAYRGTSTLALRLDGSGDGMNSVAGTRSLTLTTLVRSARYATVVGDTGVSEESCKAYVEDEEAT